MKQQQQHQTDTRKMLILMGSCLLTLILVVGFVVQSRPVAGHAEPEISDPMAGATVPEAPPAVIVTFSEEIVAEGTELTVIGPDSNRVDQADSALDLNDMDRKRVTVGLQSDLAAGTYTVNWTSVSAEDGDADEGSFTFNIGASSTPGASPEASPGASPVASPAASPESSPAA